MDVSVEDWYAFAVCYGAYCTSRVATDAWDRGLEDSGVVWEFTVEFVNDKLGTFEESLCSRVVTQAFPEGVDLFNVGPSQILDCRKSARDSELFLGLIVIKTHVCIQRL